MKRSVPEHDDLTRKDTFWVGLVLGMFLAWAILKWLSNQEEKTKAPPLLAPATIYECVLKKKE